MEGVVAVLQKEVLPQLKGKKAERRRAWLSVSLVVYNSFNETIDALKAEKALCGF